MSDCEITNCPQLSPDAFGADDLASEQGRLPPYLKPTLVAASALAVEACSGGGGGHAPTDKTQPVLPTRAQAARFLLQAQFSVNETDLNALTASGYDAWLDQQFNQGRGYSAWSWLDKNGYNVPNSKQNFFDTDPTDYMIWNQLISCPDQFRMRLALSLSEMMVVSANRLDGYWPFYYMAAYWDVLADNVFGTYRNLLERVTLNAAMGRYLNMAGSLLEDPATGREPDENYAREVMQLFSIGLWQLNNDGSYKLDANGNKIPTYNQTDVSQLARVLTGWDVDESNLTYTSVAGYTEPVPSNSPANRPLAFFPKNHSSQSASFLGTTVAAGADGIAALKNAIDTIANHPNVAPFFSKQMIQRLVTSNPSRDYVLRVAAKFNDNGSGVRGDLKAVWRAILTDTEARGTPAPPSFGKIREPIVRAVQWARTFKASSISGQWKVPDQSDIGYGLGQSPLRSPSVFNFFRPGYVPPHTQIAAQNLVAPEFQIHNESSIVGYVNYLADWIANSFGDADIKPDYSELLPLASDSQSLLDWLNLRLCANQLGSDTMALIKASIDNVPVTSSSADGDKLNRIYGAIFMTMISSEYLFAS